MGIHTSSQSWIGFMLWADNVDSFFQRKDGRSVEELAEEALSQEGSDEESDEEYYESDFFSEEGRFYSYLQHLLKPYPEVKVDLLFGGNFYTGEENWCGITLEGLASGHAVRNFEFSEEQKAALQTVKRVLEEVGFKLDEYSLCTGISVC